MKNQLNKLAGILILLGAFLLFTPNRFLIAATPYAVLRVAHNDGAQCYLNNQEVFNNLSSGQNEKYWNREIDVSGYLQSTQNILACRVSNGDGNRGTSLGFFDAELTVNSQVVISRNGTGWKYFGSGGLTTPPWYDNSGRQWYDINYSDSSWSTGNAPFNGKNYSLLTKAPDDGWFRKAFYSDGSLFNYNQQCTFFTNRISCLNNTGCIWTGSSCIDSYSATCSYFNNLADCLNKSGCTWTGSTCITAGSFSCSSFNIRAACLSIPGCSWTGSYCLSSIFTACSIFNNQADCLTKTGCSWINSTCIDTQYMYNQDLFKIRTQSLTGCWQPTIHRLDTYLKPPADISGFVLESPKPLITGLLKYGNQIEIFVDDNSVGKAVVKEGEYSGISNFYFKSKENVAPITTELTTHQLKIVATNPYDKSVCTTGPVAFIVVPYPAPIIHRLGEISYVKRANILSIKTKEPMVTGLVKYGSVVEIYIDNKNVGRAKVKQGEKTGVANFYLKLPRLTVGDHTLYAVAKKASQEDLVSPTSQVYNFSVE